MPQGPPPYARLVDIDTARLLITDEGARALERAAELPDPDSLSAGERMRREFSPELSAAALTQIGLRARARAKLGVRAELMLWTPDAVEQATRARVSAWRAERLRRAGITTVVDIGCGAGADALAFLDAGISVVGVEIDPATAVLARRNLQQVASGMVDEAHGDGPSSRVVTGDGVDMAEELIGQADGKVCVFLDPARRTARGRSWRVRDMSPSWHFVVAQLASDHACCVKLGPGFPRELLPEGADAVWVSDGADLVECSLWNPSATASGSDADHTDATDNGPSDTTTAQPQGAVPGQSDAGVVQPVGKSQTGGARSAVLLPAGIQVFADPSSAELEVMNPGRYVYEPDPAVSRAGAYRSIAGGGSGNELRPLWRLAPGVGYLSSDELFATPLASVFEVIEVLDYQLTSLKKWIRANEIGTLEIKKRAVDIDPAALRKQLRPRGANSATLMITPTTHGVRALVVRRLRDTPDSALN